jgi:Cof subfamily protein (haloacid dehalogenase superfamily)
MTASAPSDRIALVVSDVDGTLVKPDKSLDPETIAAVGRLRAAGIGFAIVSSRPPRGMAMLVEPLGLDLFAGFNGGSIVRADLSPVEQHFVPEAAATTAIGMMRDHGADIWVFDDRNWFVTDPDGHYVSHEERTVAFPPTVVRDFRGHLGRIGKIVGSSEDFAMLERCEAEVAKRLGDAASVHRSQSYYLDISDPVANKGYAVKAFAREFGVPVGEVAVLGDMANDLSMFAVAGLAIAMGNATPAVKAEAHLVTLPNTENGVAHAIDHFILPRAAARPAQR